MKIKSAYIYGFGKWQDHSIVFTDNTNSITMITGDNESGKSTLRQFLLFMLFGLPPKKRQFFQPKTGGTMGGSLTLWSNEYGEVTIERIHDRNNGEATCVDSAGNSYDQRWLQSYLNGLDLDMFTAIFSFDSNDLSKLHAISDKELGDVLLGIGMTGTDKIYSVEKLIEKHLDQQFKIQGKKPEINKKLAELENMSKQLQEVESQERTYSEKKLTEFQLSEEGRTIQEKLKRLKEKKYLLEKKIQSSKIIEDYYQLKMKIEGLQDTTGFPKNGLNRYQHLKDQLLPLKSEWSVLDGNQEKSNQEIINRQKTLLSQEMLDELERLVAKIDSYQQSKNELNYKQKQNDRVYHQVSTQLKELNIGLAIEDLDPISFPFHIDELWHSLKQDMDQLRLEKEKVLQEVDALHQQEIHLDQKAIDMEDRLIEKEEYQTLYKKLEEKKHQDHLLSVNQQQSEQVKKWKYNRKKREKQSNLIVMLGLFLSIVFVGLAVMLPANLYWLAGIIFLIAIGQRIIVKRSIQTMEALLSNQITYSEQQLSSAEVDRIEKVIDEQQQVLRQLETINHELDQLSMQRMRLAEQQKIVEQKQTQLDHQVKKQITTYPFLANVEVSYWPKLYHRLKQIITEYRELREVNADCQQLEQEVFNYEEEIISCLTQVDKNLVTEHPSHNLDFLKEMVEKQREQQNQIKEQQRWQQQIKDEKRTIEQKMTPFQKEINSLLEKAGVEDEEGFIKKASIHNEREIINNKMSENYYQLKSFLTDKEIEQIANGKYKNKLELENERTTINAKIEQLDQALEEKRQASADVKSVIQSMEQSEDYSNLKHRLQVEVETLNDQAKKWAVYQVAKEMLENTKKIYQNNYLPQVFEQTSIYFNRLTLGKYAKVLPPMNGNSIQVEDKKGLRFMVSELSQGTNDQLYIALRLSLSQVLNKTYTMPFFIDDAFVHFDDNRSSVMLRILNEISNNQQVIFFTCHSTLPKSFEEDIYVHRI